MLLEGNKEEEARFMRAHLKAEVFNYIVPLVPTWSRSYHGVTSVTHLHVLPDAHNEQL